MWWMENELRRKLTANGSDAVGENDFCAVKYSGRVGSPRHYLSRWTRSSSVLRCMFPYCPFLYYFQLFISGSACPHSPRKQAWFSGIFLYGIYFGLESWYRNLHFSYLEVYKIKTSGIFFLIFQDSAVLSFSSFEFRAYFIYVWLDHWK